MATSGTITADIAAMLAGSLPTIANQATLPVIDDLTRHGLAPADLLYRMGNSVTAPENPTWPVAIGMMRKLHEMGAIIDRAAPAARLPTPRRRSVPSAP